MSHHTIIMRVHARTDNPEMTGGYCLFKIKVNRKYVMSILILQQTFSMSRNYPGHQHKHCLNVITSYNNIFKQVVYILKKDMHKHFSSKTFYLYFLGGLNDKTVVVQFTMMIQKYCYTLRLLNVSVIICLFNLIYVLGASHYHHIFFWVLNIRNLM